MPWGQGEIIEEASFVGKWHEPALQLMKFEDGTEVVRFAHYSHGAFSRSPLMINTKDFSKISDRARRTRYESAPSKGAAVAAFGP